MSSPVQSLPDTWVERIWLSMRATYGAEFDRQWACPAGEDPQRHVANLKAFWGRELAWALLNPDAIRWGLDHLPERAPNLREFSALCRRRPDRPAPALAAPPADPRRVAEALARCRVPQGASLGSRVWAQRLREREQRGEPLCRFAREAWREVLPERSMPAAHDGGAMAGEVQTWETPRAGA